MYDGHACPAVEEHYHSRVSQDTACQGPGSRLVISLANEDEEGKEEEEDERIRQAQKAALALV